jgi:hypothetical protein
MNTFEYAKEKKNISHQIGQSSMTRFLLSQKEEEEVRLGFIASWCQ